MTNSTTIHNHRSKTVARLREMLSCGRRAVAVIAMSAIAIPINLQAAEANTMSPESIEEGQFISINGVEQWVTLRGKNRENPALLIISGPGVAMSSLAPLYASWEENFTVVQWDQLGAGASHSRSPEARAELSLERLTADGLAVAAYVRDRLNIDKLVVVAGSAGSITGLKMMQAQPDYFSAYVGTGQFVNWAEQDVLSYKMVMDKARSEENAEAINELTEIGPPPYSDIADDVIKSKYASALTQSEMQSFPALMELTQAAMAISPDSPSYLPQGIALENPRELATVAYNLLRDEIMAFDAATMSMRYEMPMFFFQGDTDLYSVTSEVEAFETEITAPSKRTVIIEDGGHSVIWMPAQFLSALKEHVLPVTTQE